MCMLTISLRDGSSVATFVRGKIRRKITVKNKLITKVNYLWKKDIFDPVAKPEKNFGGARIEPWKKFWNKKICDLDKNNYFKRKLQFKNKNSYIETK